MISIVLYFVHEKQPMYILKYMAGYVNELVFCIIWSFVKSHDTDKFHPRLVHTLPMQGQSGKEDLKRLGWMSEGHSLVRVWFTFGSIGQNQKPNNKWESKEKVKWTVLFVFSWRSLSRIVKWESKLKWLPRECHVRKQNFTNYSCDPKSEPKANRTLTNVRPSFSIFVFLVGKRNRFLAETPKPKQGPREKPKFQPKLKQPVSAKIPYFGQKGCFGSWIYTEMWDRNRPK